MTNDTEKFLALYITDVKTRELLVGFFKERFEIEVLSMNSVSQLQSVSGRQGVVVSDFHKIEDQAFLLFIKSNPTINCLVSGAEKNEIWTVIPHPIELSDLEIFVKDCLDLEPKKSKEYIAIEIQNFHYLRTVPCDVFIKLGKEGESERFVKRLYGNQIFEESEIKKYESKGITQFFVRTCDQQLFFNYLVEKFTPEKYIEEGNRRGYVDVNSDIHGIMNELLDKSSLTSESFELAQMSIKNMARTVQNSGNLLGLLKDLLKNKSGFNYKHSFLISVFTYEVMKLMDLGKTSRLTEQHDMMSFVAFYHDILLKDDKLVKINNKKDFYRAEVSAEEKTLIKNHAKMVADLVGETGGTPAGASQILKHHHGMTNGIGFPSSYNAGIPVLAIVFIVCEFFVLEILQPDEEGVSLEAIFSRCDEEFTLPSYRKTLGYIKQIFNYNK